MTGPVRFVETATGARVAIYPDGRTLNGFLPVDAWKQVGVDRARREMLRTLPDLSRGRPERVLEITAWVRA